MKIRKEWIVIAVLALIGVYAFNTFGKDEAISPTQVDATTTKQVWKLFKPQNGRFEVLFPSVPQHVTESHPEGKDMTKYDVYLAQDGDGSIYMISFTDYPPSYAMGSVDDVLEAVKNGAVGANSKAEVKQVERSTFLNLPSLDFSLTNSDSAIRSKVILDERTLIVLTVMNRDPTHLDKDFNTFTGSFVIKKDSSKLPS